MACGLSHVAGLGSTGAVFVWGDALVPREVRLPASRSGFQAVAVAAAQYSTYAVSAAGDAFSWDEHWHDAWRPTPRRLPELRQVVTICAAEGHSVGPC